MKVSLQSQVVQQIENVRIIRETDFDIMDTNLRCVTDSLSTLAA